MLGKKWHAARKVQCSRYMCHKLNVRVTYGLSHPTSWPPPVPLMLFHGLCLPLPYHVTSTPLPPSCQLMTSSCPPRLTSWLRPCPSCHLMTFACPSHITSLPPSCPSHVTSWPLSWPSHVTWLPPLKPFDGIDTCVNSQPSPHPPHVTYLTIPLAPHVTSSLHRLPIMCFLVHLAYFQHLHAHCTWLLHRTHTPLISRTCFWMISTPSIPHISSSWSNNWLKVWLLLFPPP